MRMAVIGGTGTVGALTVTAALERGHDVAVISRSGRAPAEAVGHRADIATGEGLADALAGAEVAIDVSNADDTDPKAAFRQLAQHIVSAADAAHGQRLVVLSIVGIDHIPYPYYAGKRAQERVYLDSGLPVSILRTTQFHEFAGQLLDETADDSVSHIPDLLVQPVAASEVAEALVDLAERPVAGRAADLGGPDVHRLPDLAQRLVRRRGGAQQVVAAPPEGRAGELMATGALLLREGRRGDITFDQWLALQ